MLEGDGGGLPSLDTLAEVPLREGVLAVLSITTQLLLPEDWVLGTRAVLQSRDGSVMICIGAKPESASIGPRLPIIGYMFPDYQDEPIITTVTTAQHRLQSWHPSSSPLSKFNTLTNRVF